MQNGEYDVTIPQRIIRVRAEDPNTAVFIAINELYSVALHACKVEKNESPSLRKP